MAQQQKQDAYWSKHESKYRVSFARVFSAKGQELSSGRKKKHLAQEGEGLMLTLISICLFVQLNSLFKHSHNVAEE